jgi:hypothetical protein
MALRSSVDAGCQSKDFSFFPYCLVGNEYICVDSLLLILGRLIPEAQFTLELLNVPRCYVNWMIVGI